MTKEELIEKIREKVILTNNFECNTYEEALEKETMHPDCYSIFTYTDWEYNTGEHTVLEKGRGKGWERQSRKEYTNIYYKLTNVLGREITLLSILKTLNYISKNEFMYGIFRDIKFDNYYVYVQNFMTGEKESLLYWGIDLYSKLEQQ